MNGEELIKVISLLGNYIIVVGNYFFSSLKVAKNLDSLVTLPLYDWMMLNYDHSAQDSILFPDNSTPGSGVWIEGECQTCLCPVYQQLLIIIGFSVCP